MSPKERAKLGKAGRTMDEIQTQQAAKTQSELQNQLRSLLALREIVSCTPIYGKRTGILPGWPDITFAYCGVPCAWEVKIGKNDLQDVQVRVRAQMEANGWRYAVVRSVEEGRSFLEQIRITHDTQPN